MEAKYQHESVTDVLGLSVTDVPVHTPLRFHEIQRGQELIIDFFKKS
jgi:hypothetical protein